MRKIIKMGLLSVVTGLLLVGCGVDNDKLAALTGDKNYEQIKQEYALSVLN